MMQMSHGAPSATRTAAVTGIVLAAVFLGLLSFPGVVSATPPHPAATPLAPVHVEARPAAAPTASAWALPAAPAPATGFPRTVLAEPFTELWCEYCPYESQAMYPIEHSEPSSSLVVAELHPCVTGNYSNCDDLWPTLDGIADYREGYYDLQGFPTVYFDGTTAIVGDVNSDTAKELEAVYLSAIQNASLIPGNVSISQSSSITGPMQETTFENITSDISGTYLALTYLTEDIDENVSGTGGVHDIGNVVRAAIINESVTLTAGETTSVRGTVALTPGWNITRLSSVALVQDFATKVVENANEVPVTTITTDVSASQSSIDTDRNATITVQAVNSTTGAPVAGAVVTLSAPNGGSVDPVSGVTSTAGTFTSVFTAPSTTDQETVGVTALVSAPGATGAPVTTEITVEPIVAPSVPLGVSAVPGQSAADLQWSAPASGGSGVTYHVYRATTPSGPFTAVGSTALTSYTDTTVTNQQPYWYRVDAQGAAGYSANATQVLIVPVVGTPAGLPATVNWSLTLGSTVYYAAGTTPISLYVGTGAYSWTVEANSTAYLPPAINSGSFVVAQSAVAIPAAFLPNYAFLDGTVSPTDATVLLNGTAVTLTQGTFTEKLLAGTYSFKVSAPGYVTQQTNLTVAPGASVSHTFTLAAVSSGSTATSGGGLTTTETLALVGVAVVAVAALAVGLLYGRNRQGPRSGNGGGAN